MWQPAINKASSVSSVLIRVRNSSERDKEAFWEKEEVRGAGPESSYLGFLGLGASRLGDMGLKSLLVEDWAFIFNLEGPGPWGQSLGTSGSVMEAMGLGLGLRTGGSLGWVSQDWGVSGSRVSKVGS